MSVATQWIGAIISYIRKTYNLTIGERTAEAIKIEIGSAKVIGENREDGNSWTRPFDRSTENN